MLAPCSNLGQEELLGLSPFALRICDSLKTLVLLEALKVLLLCVCHVCACATAQVTADSSR